MERSYSVIIPIYQTEPYLERCIDSVISSFGDSAEIILINDGSPDGSAQICQEYKNRFSNILYIEKENEGLAQTRNVGIFKAGGEYIFFVDSDDYLDIEATQKLTQFIVNNPGCDVYFANNFRDVDGVTKYENWTSIDTVVSGQDFFKTQMIYKTFYTYVWRNVYRRSFIQNNQLLFKPGIYHEDDLWFPNVLLKASKTITTDICFYHYIIRSNSIMGQKSLKNYQDAYKNCELLSDLYCCVKDRQLKRLLKNQLFNSYIHAILKARKFNTVLPVSRNVIIKNARTVKNIFRAILILVNFNQYYKLTQKKAQNIET